MHYGQGAIEVRENKQLISEILNQVEAICVTAAQNLSYVGLWPYIRSLCKMFESNWNQNVFYLAEVILVSLV